LTQAQLAKRVGTMQSAIGRLEDADHEGHSLAMPRRIARAVGCVGEVRVLPSEPVQPAQGKPRKALRPKEESVAVSALQPIGEK
jgi:transcriptional regulator with XRE-family HTH domain